MLYSFRVNEPSVYLNAFRVYYMAIIDVRVSDNLSFEIFF